MQNRWFVVLKCYIIVTEVYQNHNHIILDYRKQHNSLKIPWTAAGETTPDILFKGVFYAKTDKVHVMMKMLSRQYAFLHFMHAKSVLSVENYNTSSAYNILSMFSFEWLHKDKPQNHEITEQQGESVIAPPLSNRGKGNTYHTIIPAPNVHRYM